MSTAPPINPDQIWRLLAAASPHRSDAIRMACVLEATAPKVGNVHPAAHFHDLNYCHFVNAADAAAQVLGELDCVAQVGAAIRCAVTASVLATGTNVNLGIVLLLAPLVASEPSWDQATTTTAVSPSATWRTRTAEVLGQLDGEQGAMIAAAISGAKAGGLSDESLGIDHPLDLTKRASDAYDIMAAMRLAAPRDRIALQYAGGYRDLFDHVVPTLQHWVAETGDLLSGIVWAHISLIAESGDSLIARKCGQAESDRVAELAGTCLAAREHSSPPDPSASIHRLDAALRSDGNRLNPGTTADLIAAAIYVLLRSRGSVGPKR